MALDGVKDPVDEGAVKVGSDQVGELCRDLVCAAGEGSVSKSAVDPGEGRVPRGTHLPSCGYRA